MIDMIFLLLIFFLVAANWRPKEDFLPFQLPSAQAHGARIGAAEPLMIYIMATQTGCQVRIGESYTVEIENGTIEANLASLMGKLNECMLKQKRFVSDPIEIVCGPKVKAEYWIKIWNVLEGLGLSDITFQMTE